MAKYTGNAGDVTVGGTTMAEVRQWSLNTAIATANNAAKGDDWETHSVGRKNWSAAITCLFDSASAQQLLMVAGYTATLVLRAGTAAGNPTFAGSGVVTSVVRESPEDSAQELLLTLTIQGTGALTRGTVGA